jgi:zinc protease
MTTLARALGALCLTLLTAVQALAAADIQRVVSPGGIEAWLVEEPAIPMVAIEAAFAGGAALDPEGAEGAANFMAAMLEEGAGDLSAVEFAGSAQLLGARFSFGAGRDSVTVSARILSEALEESVDLLRLALVAPRFDDEPMRRVRGQILSSLRSDETDPNAIARKTFFAAAFPDDPYGRPTDGTLDSVAALSAQDLEAARARLLHRGGLKVGVVGDITAEALGPLLDRLFGDLPAAPPPELPMTALEKPGGLTLVDFPAPQSTVMFGHAGPLRDDPDFIPLYVLNYILGGGGFSSRLTVEVREKRGLAYSTYAYLAPLDRAGLWIGGVGTANERVAESIEVIRQEWRRMAEEGPTDEEIRKAKQYLTGAYPLRFDSNAGIARILVGLQEARLGIDYPEIRNDLVEAVTAEDLRRVAAEWLKPEALAFVVVGQPEGLSATQ